MCLYPADTHLALVVRLPACLVAHRSPLYSIGLCSDGQFPVMCRLDFLPRSSVHVAGPGAPAAPSLDQASSEQPLVESVEWLLSEVEGQWCEGFFRAAPERAVDLFLEAVRSRAEEKRAAERTGRQLDNSKNE